MGVIMNKSSKNLILTVLLSFAAQAGLSATWYNPLSWRHTESPTDATNKAPVAAPTENELKSFEAGIEEVIKKEASVLAPAVLENKKQADLRAEEQAKKQAEETKHATEDMANLAKDLGHDFGSLSKDMKQVNKTLEDQKTKEEKTQNDKISLEQKKQLTDRSNDFQEKMTDEEYAEIAKELNEIIAATASTPFRIAENFYNFGSEVANIFSWLLMPLQVAQNHSLLLGMGGLYYLGTQSLFTIFKFFWKFTKYTLKATKFVVSRARVLLGYFMKIQEYLGPTGMIIGGVSLIAILFGAYWFWLQSNEKKVHYYAEDLLSSVETLKVYPTDSVTAGKLMQTMCDLGNLAKTFLDKGNFYQASTCYTLIDSAKRALPF